LVCSVALALQTFLWRAKQYFYLRLARLKII
jgi:hypothetical protein